VATFVISNLDRSLSAGVALIKQAAPLPLDPAAVRDMLLAQAGLPVAVGKHLDLGAPIAGAAVLAGPGRSPLTAFSFACHAAADVPALLGVLGRTVARRGAAVQIENAAGDRGWFLPQGNVVVLADTDEALVRAGSLALEARRNSKDDVSVMLYPEMVARAAGTDVKTALERLLADIDDKAAASGGKMGPEATRQVREIAEYLAGAARAELALSLDPDRGASFLARLHPKAGSKLEAMARQTKTIAIDPSLLTLATGGKEDAGFAVTSAYGGATLEQIRRQRGKLQPGSGKGNEAAGRFLDALAEGLTGELSMTGRIQPAFSAELIYRARDGESAARIRAELAKGNKESVAAIVAATTQGEGLGVKAQRVRQESVRNLRALHATLVLAPPGDEKGFLRKFVGPAGVDVFMAVVGGDRLAVTMGPGAKARLASIASPEAAATQKVKVKVKAKASAAGPPAIPALSGAVAAASGRSLFYFFDLRQVFSVALTVASDPRFRALEGAMRTPMPVMGGATGDAQGTPFTMDLTIPPSCFAGMGALVQAGMMMK
jgi:hypothetical protein